MNTTFNSSHISTLKQLIELAEKNDCRISFGYNSSTSSDVCDLRDMDENFYDDHLEKEINNQNIEFSNINYSTSKIWFELYDNKKKTYNTLAYIESNFNSSYEIIEEDTFTKELNEWICDNDCGSDDFLSITETATIIRGWGKDCLTDNRVYRADMALHYFTELVCEYLKAEMIHNVY